MRNYNDLAQDFKLAAAAEWAGISRRNIGILAMWLTGIGIPESLHEFVTAVFVSGNWDNTDEDEISLKRMARSISPGTDTDGSIRRAYERLKKASPRFFEWQQEQPFEVIPREVIRNGKRTQSVYKFPHFQLLAKLFHLPEKLTQKQVRAEVAKAMGDLALPPPKPRERKKRSPEAVAACNARTLEELLALTSTPIEAGQLLSEAWRTSLGDDVVEAILKALQQH